MFLQNSSAKRPANILTDYAPNSKSPPFLSQLPHIGVYFSLPESVTSLSKFHRFLAPTLCLDGGPPINDETLDLTRHMMSLDSLGCQMVASPPSNASKCLRFSLSRSSQIGLDRLSVYRSAGRYCTAFCSLVRCILEDWNLRNVITTPW